MLCYPSFLGLSGFAGLSCIMGLLRGAGLVVGCEILLIPGYLVYCMLSGGRGIIMALLSHWYPLCPFMFFVIESVH
ncbi:hypothetical protein F5144DRAFT_568148 [Chaetomium tenue]|uniref:Uncharacterized protein n=1 Tax=Chaetomium tenue TaxID=1854479 RepID=A0ACB7PBR0_9PEZI|nr:hypothetical protein F5144DRAFT_568148 [Chaetomium globosum]